MADNKNINWPRALVLVALILVVGFVSVAIIESYVFLQFLKELFQPFLQMALEFFKNGP